MGKTDEGTEGDDSWTPSAQETDHEFLEVDQPGGQFLIYHLLSGLSPF